jgi:hypothetical protein
VDAVKRRAFIGVDIGQRVDPTALAVVEHEDRRDRCLKADGQVEERLVRHHLVRYLARLPLGTPYPEVAERLAQVAAGVHEKTGRRPTLYLDATGVGQPVVDELRRHKVQAQLIPVYFTHGDRRMQGENNSITLGKAWLVSRMQALFQGNRLHLPPGHPEAEALVKELLDYEIRVDQDANDKYGAFKVGTHDDLVTALGLATQEDGDPEGAARAREVAKTQPYRTDARALRRFGQVAR